MHRLVARAPTRIDFGGGWTDVPPYSEERGGCVCNMAIQLHAVATIQEHPGAQVAGSHPDGVADSALAAAAIRRTGLTGAALRLSTEFPVGAGLGGSSSAGVATLGAVAAWREEPVSAEELAEESRQLEVEDLGIAGGRQDHYAAALGGALGLWFGGRVTARSLTLPAAVVAELESRCIVAYTGQSRISADTITAVTDAYRARERRVLASLDRMRDLAAEMVRALEAGDVDELGGLVGEHWIFQRSLHPAIPTPVIDAILADAAAAGAIGGKALGASGGGCVLAIAGRGHEDNVRRAMAARAQPLPLRVARLGFQVVTPRDSGAVDAPTA